MSTVEGEGHIIRIGANPRAKLCDIYLSSHPSPTSDTPRRTTWPARLIILIAYLIPLFIYLNRFLIPDYSYDSLNYHLFNGYRALHYGIPFSTSEFFPGIFANLPAPLDLVFTLSRLSLGYRLGTLLGLVSYLLCISVLIKIARRCLVHESGRLTAIMALAVLYGSINLELLFQLATYFVDIPGTLLTAVSYLALLKFNHALKTNESWKLWLTFTSLMSGLSLFAKITDIAFIIPTLLIITFTLYGRASRQLSTAHDRVRWTIISYFIVAIPSLTSWIPNYLLSGNPVFPYFNSIFRSPYTAPINIGATSVGGITFLQRLIWPLASLINPARLAEPNSLFTDYQLTVVWLSSIIVCIFSMWGGRSLSAPVRLSAFYVLTGITIWSLLFGVERYISFDLMLGSILVVPALRSFAQLVSAIPLRKLIGGLLVMCMLFQVAQTVRFNLKYDMSWRPGMVENPSLYFSQGRLLFESHESLGLSPLALSKIQIIVDCAIPSAGYSILTSLKNLPVVNLAQNPVYLPTTTDPRYLDEVELRLRSRYPGRSHTVKYDFASFATLTGLNDTVSACVYDLKHYGAHIKIVKQLPNFLGYSGQSLEIVLGSIKL